MKLGDAKPKTRSDAPRLEDLVDVLNLPAGKWIQIRLLDTDILPIKTHWINIMTRTTNRQVRIPKLCVNFDPATEGVVKGVKCAYCEAGLDGSTAYLANVLVRSRQEDAPSRIRMTQEEKDSGFKDPGSESWTPVSVMRIPATLMQKIQGLKDLNKRKNRKTGKTATFDVNHPRFGIDLNIKYNPNAKGGDKYEINLAMDSGPLTEEELSYLVYDLSDDLIARMGRETPQESARSLEGMELVSADQFDDGDDLGSSGKGRSSSKSQGRGRGRDDDDDLGDDPPPRRGGGSGSKNQSRGRSNDDDDLGDDGDDSLDDDPPPRRGGSGSKNQSRGRSNDDDDDLDDDPPPRRGGNSGAKNQSRGRNRDDDDLGDDDDDLGEDDDDQDDDPPPRRSGNSTSRNQGRGRDRDDPPPRRGSGSSGSKGRGRDDDDDDDGDIDDDDIPF